ncbi:MAG: transcriptional regulator [Alphaproteobacteria bacterium]|nr:MAG: transcriptional regulator [Alphaproteobacteria bacterium]
MKQNDKNNKIKKSNIDDRNISKDFSEIFDITENIEDIGSLFIDARVKKGLTQEDVSKILKVRISAIKQIESGEELESLGSAYRLGFLRSYAKLVDLDPENIIKNYKSSNSEKNIKFDYNFPSVTKEKKSLLPIIALCTFLFSLVIYSSWYYLNINKLETENKNITYLDNDNNNLDYVKIEDKKNIPLDNTDKINSENIVISEKETSKIIINENFKNKVVDNNEDGSKILLEPNTLTETSISNETSAIANERTPKEEMVLKSSGNSWVEIEDLDGNSYLTRLMRSGETFVVPDKKGLTLSTGNAGVLSLTFGSTHISKLGSVGEVISSRPLNIEAFKKR